MEQATERGHEVLEAALSLVAEKGIAGASLRKLAERLGLSQPSLYHYFKSKDELIDQLTEYGARRMVDAMQLSRIPSMRVKSIPHFIKDRLFDLWDGDDHLRYSKFLFVVGIESPRHQKVIRRVFDEQLLGEPPALIAALFATDPDLAHRLVESLTMMARAIGFAMVEDRILFGMDGPSERTRKHAEFVADAVTQLLTRPW